MSRRRLISLAVFALALPAALLVAALAVQRAGSVWTDGMALAVPANQASPRNIIWRPAEAVRGAVNTDIDEYEPKTSPDGTLLIFVRRRPDANADLVQSRWTAQGWTNPEPIASVNSDADELGPEFAADGRSLWFASNREGGEGGFDLWFAAADSEGWASPIPAGPAVNTRYDEYGPALTPDGRRLFFASDRPRPDEPVLNDDRAWSATMRERKHRHDHDLYTAPITAEGAQRAERLDVLSTQFDEGAPATSPSGDFLYFASDRLGTRGGFDLFRSRLVDDIPQPPERLDDTVNSAANDLDPAIASDGFRLYFSSDRGSSSAGSLFAASSDRGDYGIWWTTSREVFRGQSGLAATLIGLLSAVWPWLLLLALLAASLLLLIALARAALSKAEWRRRFSRLSLLARCLVLSLLLHALIASMLAVWTVGLKVGELLRAGGTRVILASSSGEDAQALQIMASPIALGPVAAMATSMSIPTLALDAPRPPAPHENESPLPARFVEPVPSATNHLADATALPPTDESARIDARTPSAPAPDAAMETSITTSAAPTTAAVVPFSIGVPNTSSRNLIADAAVLPVREVAASPFIDERATAAVPTAPRINMPEPTLAVPNAAAPQSPAPEPTTPTQPDSPASRLSDALRPASGTAPSSASLRSALETPALPPSERDSDLAVLSLTTSTPWPTPPADLPPNTPSALAPRIPSAPTEVPAPLETFAQRDPEERSALVDQLGGSAETEKAVGRALEWFRRMQSPDGRWASRELEARVDADGAMTGLALLCFLGAGHTHVDDGPYRETVSAGLRWLVARQSASGDLRGAARGRDSMYGQTVGAVALCEAYAMTSDPALATAARRAVDFVIATSRNPRAANDADTAVLGWLIMTVESARRAGFEPPPDVFRSAAMWLDSVARPESRGRYAYRAGDQASVGMTAEAMFVQQILGHTLSEARMQQSAELVLSSPPRWDREAPTHSWYYATLALFQHQGESWKRWNETLAPVLLDHQRTDGAFAGSWDPQDRWSQLCGRAYQTAVCTLSLEVYYRYRLDERGDRGEHLPSPNHRASPSASLP